MNMKCACGYECEISWENKYREFVKVKGDEEFIETKIQCYINPDWALGYSSRTEERTVYACPKCGTLKINI